MTVVEVQPGNAPGESNSADVGLAETKPRENDRNGNDGTKPESGVAFVGMGQGLAWLSVVIDEENNLSPAQN